MNSDASSSWDKFLTPESLKRNLIAASLFLAAYEMLKACIVEPVRGFFTVGFGENGEPILHDDYRTKVLGLNKNPDVASLLWLKRLGVLDKDDLKSIDTIRLHRNKLAHELPMFVTSTEAEINIGLLTRITDLMEKIDKWWILEVHIPSNPDFDHQEIKLNDIISLKAEFVKIMIEIATGGSDANYWDVFKEFRIRLDKFRQQGQPIN